MADTQRTLDALWRIEGARIVATLAKMTGDLGQAEDLAQEALVDGLAQWPGEGIPKNAGAWITAVAKRKAIDAWRRTTRLDERQRELARNLRESTEQAWEPIDDDMLRLVFTACHPVLSREAQVALTLRVVGGLRTEEIARMMLVPVATVQQRIVRAKKTLAAAKIPFEAPEAQAWGERLSAVLAVIYLVFTEGYAATAGDDLIRRELANEALRLGRVLLGLLPREPEVAGLVALMEIQASRFSARISRDGSPILLADQDRSRWDHSQIMRGRRALERADALRHGRGFYALQAAIAECHAVARSVGETDWDRIVLLYGALCSLAPGPVVELNRAVAVSMAEGPDAALRIVDHLAKQGALASSHLLPSVRGELLARLGRNPEAVAEFHLAASLVGNRRMGAVFRAKAEDLQSRSSGELGRPPQ